MPDSKKSFLRQFLKEKKMVGSMIPSSRFLARKMLSSVDFAVSRVFVELGPGNGVFTKLVLEQMSADSKLYVFELNDMFFKVLKAEITDPRVVLIHDSAEKIGEYLKRDGLTSADVVLSSLPLANFSTGLKAKILSECYNILREAGIYVQFQYSLNAKKAIKAIFKNIRITFTPANFPPAFVYICKK